MIFPFRCALDGDEEVLDRPRAPGPKERPNKKECDRCGHRPGRRVQCRICRRAVGPCCLETENPVPLCKDCWEPEPEMRRTEPIQNAATPAEGRCAQQVGTGLNGKSHLSCYDCRVQGCDGPCGWCGRMLCGYCISDHYWYHASEDGQSSAAYPLR